MTEMLEALEKAAAGVRSTILKMALLYLQDTRDNTQTSWETRKHIWWPYSQSPDVDSTEVDDATLGEMSRQLVADAILRQGYFKN